MKNFVLLLTVIFGSAITVRCFELEKQQFHSGLTENTKDFHHAVCNNNYESDYVCKVTRETPLVDAAYIIKTCPVKISVSHLAHHNEMQNLVPLNHDYALLVSRHWRWSDPVATSIHIIRMTDCQVVELMLENTLVKKVGPLTPKERTFQVIYESNVNCADYFCTVTYNLDGELVHNATQYTRKPTFGEKEFAQPAYFSDYSESKLVYYIQWSDVDRLYRVHQNGSKTEVFSIDPRKNSYKYTFRNGKLGTCAFDDESYMGVCKQHDSRDNDKVVMNFELDFNKYINFSKIHFFKTYNMRDGGMMLLVVEFKNNEVIDNLRIVRVNKDGQPSAPLDIPFENYGFGNFNEFVAVEDDTSICLKLVYLDTSEGLVYKRRIECVPKSKLEIF